VVDDHVTRMTENDRLLLDQDCLQWTPPVHSDDDDDDDETSDVQVVNVDLMSSLFYIIICSML